jgi:hypothetical protein
MYEAEPAHMNLRLDPESLELIRSAACVPQHVKAQAALSGHAGQSGSVGRRQRRPMSQAGRSVSTP